MERLGHQITQALQGGSWKGLKLSRNSPPLSHLFFADDLLLFGKASTSQMEVMRDIMRDFCGVSGHRVNLAKSKLFLSRNVNFNRALELGNDLGIGVTGDLGKYLGVPLIHGRVTKLTYFPIIQKVRKRMAGWKGRFLTMAGRTVLIKAVLAALPSYHMQTMLLPKGILQEIERISRSFFWNQNQEGRKMHLIAWDSIKQGKEQGGLGIKDLHRQNVAFIMKLCWQLLTNPGALWVRCLKGKYGCDAQAYPMVYRKQNSSRVWSDITKVWGRFYSGVGKKLNNRSSTNVW